MKKENPMSNLDDNTQAWGIVELMGHKVVAGLVSKSEMLGKPLLRVDVPATSAFPEFTQFYGEAAIYCVTFVSEQVARLTAEQTKLNPVSVYVPELITKERLNEIIGQYQEQIKRLRALPEPDDEND
jgi:hypothetical protein